MAIDQVPCREANNLAQPEKTFYPVRIPVSHWQLRHYISLPEPDLLYYASGHDIYCLNTATKKRRLIATLPFEARCTASGYGWVCVGGEDEGHFAAIKLDGRGPRTSEVDSALPLEYWRQNRRAPTIKVERIGEEIVNSISIHRIQDEDAHLDDIVAVLTNNDKTVRIYSLPQSLETTVLDLPFAMNHATVSPDGQTLVAVGDYNQAYFFSREIHDTPPQIPKPHNRLTSASLGWTLSCVRNLHVTTPEAAFGYFTTAWSPSGQLVAVGSEGGYITVFDVRTLDSPDFEDDAAVVAVIPSSRAEHGASHAGAVRSMVFSPEPWDLLIWAEDQGRVCIGDLRTGLRTRQVIHLEPKEEGLKKVDYEDLLDQEQLTRSFEEWDQDFRRRHGYGPTNTSNINFATEYIQARRRREQTRADNTARWARATTPPESGEDAQRPLSVEEQQVLDALRTNRQREEALSNGRPAPSVNYTTPDLFPWSTSRRSQLSSTQSSGRSSTRPISDILNEAADMPELSRIRAADSPRPPSSYEPNIDVVLPPFPGSRRSNADTASSTAGGSSARSTTEASQDTRTDATSTQGTGGEEDNPWRTIEEHMTLAQGPLFQGRSSLYRTADEPMRSDTASPRQPTSQQAEDHDNATTAERTRPRSAARQQQRVRDLRAHRIAAEAAWSPSSAARSSTENVVAGPRTMATNRRTPGFPEGYETLLRRAQVRGYPGREIGVRTAGLAMSPDGRTLWAACEEGIFEVQMNLKGRMFLPSIEPR